MAADSELPGKDAPFVLVAVAFFCVLALVIRYLPWLPLVVVGYAYASRLRHHRAVMAWLWALAGAATLGLVLSFIFQLLAIPFPLLGITFSEVGPVHTVPGNR
jgi:hypothetical protein